MTTYISERDMLFQVFEHLGVSDLLGSAKYSDHDLDTFKQSLETALAISKDVFANHNRKNDLQEPELVEGKVVMIPEIKIAYQAFVDGGFMAASRSFEDGGMQLPQLVTQACFAYFQAANIATASYAFLSSAAANMLENFASQSLKDDFLTPILEGRFTGTMALTEPEAGSSLADLTMEAQEQADGSYRLRGQKIFISAGDHSLSVNIVHLVLGRIKGAPKGTKGISLFVVPKLRKDELGQWVPNDVNLSGLFHKLGWRGTTSTSLNFGENGDCHGYLLGEAHAGLKYMFSMMNEARIGVGLGASALAYAGYQHSLEYARVRKQGRLPSMKASESPVALIEHADIKRMLLEQKVYAEGGLSLCLYAARLSDDYEVCEDATERKAKSQLLSFLTPIVKSWPSEYGIKANDLAIQVLGGYGFTREYPVEQYYRDNRLNPIHEGTKGIQAIDLLGRKILADGGATFKQFVSLVQTDIESASAELKDCAGQLGELLGQLSQAVRFAFAQVEKEGMDRLLARANSFLDAAGHTVIGWMWLRQAQKAIEKLDTSGKADRDFYQGKIKACEFFFAMEAPQVALFLTRFKGEASSYFDMQDSHF